MSTHMLCFRGVRKISELFIWKKALFEAMLTCISVCLFCTRTVLSFDSTYKESRLE